MYSFVYSSLEMLKINPYLEEMEMFSSHSLKFFWKSGTNCSYEKASKPLL